MPINSVTRYVVFGCYPWDAFSFLKENGGGVYLVEKGSVGVLEGEEGGENAVQM